MESARAIGRLLEDCGWASAEDLADSHKLWDAARAEGLDPAAIECFALDVIDGPGGFYFVPPGSSPSQVTPRGMFNTATTLLLLGAVLGARRASR